MKELYQQMHYYLNMDEEIPFADFDKYYKKVIAYFSEEAEQFDEDHLWKALFIAENVMSNAEGRAKEVKGSKSKKYSKMAQRLTLWAQNFAARLGAKGYNEEQMNARFEQMFEDEV